MTKFEKRITLSKFGISDIPMPMFRKILALSVVFVVLLELEFFFLTTQFSTEGSTTVLFCARKERKEFSQYQYKG